MKNTMNAGKMIASAIAICATVVAVAEPVTVSTVAELQSALAAANDGTEIVISAGEMPPKVYDLSAAASMSRAGHLYAGVSITLRGSTDNPADVVLVGSTNRILYCQKSGNVIRNLTFKNGCCTNNPVSGSGATEPYEQQRGAAIHLRVNRDTSLIANCVFSGNVATYGGAVANYSAANNASLENWAGRFYDCVFTNNAARYNGGAAYNVGLMSGCRFVGNRLLEGLSGGSRGAAVYQAHFLDDCDFEENGSDQHRNGVVYNIGTVATTNQTIHNCRFRRNIAEKSGAAIGLDSLGLGSGTFIMGCLFESNRVVGASQTGGAVHMMTNVWDCTFIGNSAQVGGAACNSTLHGCTFIGNYINPFNANTVGGAAINNCKAYDCTFTENVAQYGAVASSSSFVRCIISNNYPVASAAVPYVHNQNGRITINCAFDSCRVQNEVCQGVLFADNSYVTNSLVTACTNIFLVGHNVSKNISMVNCTVVSNKFTKFVSYVSNTGNMHILNSLFFGNNEGYDFDDSTPNCLKSITNSVFSVSSTSYLPDSALDTGAGNYNYADTTFNPGFVGSEIYPEDPYALALWSPCARTYHGKVQGWMTTANDIRGEGFPRLRNGVVDIGCYQCWERILPGFMMMVK